MKKFFYLVLLVWISAACSKMEVDEPLPTLDQVSPENMDSELPRIDITADTDSLDYLFTYYTRKVHMQVNVEFFDAEGKTLFNQTASMEIKGAASAAFDMKPLGLAFHEPIDNSQGQIIDLQQASNLHSLHTLQSIRLRNSGQDYGYTMIKDLAFSRYAAKMGVPIEVKYGRPVQAFINGEYYGLINLRTELDRLALSHLVQVDTNNITLIKLDNKNGNLEYRQGNEYMAEALRTAIRAKDVDAIHRLVDIDNFIEYIVYEDFIGNNDWPFNNVAAYSANGEPFKFLLFDLDMASVKARVHLLPELEYRDDDLSKMYQILQNQSPGFDNRVRQVQKKWYAQLSSASFNRFFDDLAFEIEEEIPYLIAKRSQPESVFQWKMNLEQVKRDFHENDRLNRKFYDL